MFENLKIIADYVMILELQAHRKFYFCTGGA